VTDAVPGDAGTADAVPGDVGPGGAGPGDAVPGDAVPGDVGPGGAGAAASPGLDVTLVVEQLRRAVPGGIGTYCRGLVQGLVELAAEGGPGPAVTLLASRPPGEPDPLAALGLPLRTLPLPGPLLTRAWDRGLLAAAGTVVHATSLAAPPARGALVVTVHDLAWQRVPDAYPRRGRRWHQAALRRAVRRARLLVVPADWVADDLVAGGVPAGRVVVVAHGTDHLPAPDAAAAGALLRKLGVDGPFLLSVGTLEPRKNLSRLLAAHRAATDAKPPGAVPPLVVVGPTGWGDIGIQGVAGGGPVSGGRANGARAIAAGPVTGSVLAALYVQATALAYVPLVEGYGLPPVEAMRAGTPVVASPLPSTGGAALQVDPTDVDAVARALVAVSTDEAVRAELVAAGRRHAARRWRDSAAEHVALWGALA
jgi:glycosyltransferase involved in cell wall biosynthesis